MGWRSGQRYSQDLRDRVLLAVDGGMAVIEAAATFRVILDRFRSTECANFFNAAGYQCST